MASESLFNLKTAAIFRAVKFSGNPVLKLFLGFKGLFLALFFLLALIFSYGFFSDAFSQSALSLALGFSIIFFDFFLVSRLIEAFLNSKLKQPKLKIRIEAAVLDPEKHNLADFLSFKVARAVFVSGNDLTVLLYNLLRQNPELNFIFNRALLNTKEIKKNLKENLANSQKENFEEMILESLKIAQQKGKGRVEIGDLLTALAKYSQVFKKILIESNLKVQDIENLTYWLEYLERKIGEGKRFWDWKNLAKIGSLAKEWASGFTVTLDQFSVDVTDIVRAQGFPSFIGHQKAVEAAERILARRDKNNVLIVGEPGSGRKSIIMALAKKAALGESLAELNYKRVVRLDLQALLAQQENMESSGAVLNTIFGEVISAGNIILEIEDLHNFVGGAARPGTIDISGVLAPYLASPRFQFIAVTTFEGLHRNIEQNSSLLSFFEKVEVAEVSERETLMLLENLVLNLEARYKTFVSYPALRNIIDYCGKYLAATPFPEKAMKLLTELMVYASQKKAKVLLPEHVAKVISEKTQIPVGEIELKEREILLNLENLLHQRIINQEEAVSEVSSALRRARTELSTRSGPIGSFLFLGPTGVGKTETSKALAAIYFGSESRMIRLDMSEFQNATDIPRLLGSPGEEGLLTTKVRENPFALLLLDEIEKAHPNILNLFLQVLDEGHLTDGMGRKVDFKNTIIIATSNAGYQIILEAIKDKTEWKNVKQKLFDYFFEGATFRPEFINRFDAVVVFGPLSKENLLKIAGLQLLKLKKILAEKDVEFVVTDSLKEKIVDIGYDPTFGARNMQRVIQDKIGNVLAKALLSRELKRGDKVEVDSEEFTLKIN
ncbi:MAG: ATP-dependent Clp protease ATP-binding subunit [bacterium]|nr:ATP-dependent Clp protease ATP-binding subunit [bacterium]